MDAVRADPLVVFNSEECASMHIACLATHNEKLVAEVREKRPGFYADPSREGYFAKTERHRLYERHRDILPLLRGIAVNEIRNFASTEAGTGRHRGVSERDHWRALSSITRKLEEFQ